MHDVRVLGSWIGRLAVSGGRMVCVCVCGRVLTRVHAHAQGLCGGRV